jgi:hypothetical protein
MANRKISDLTALTAPATGDLLPIVDISEAAAADKNKKITYGELLASAPAGSAAAPSFSFDGDPNTGIFNPAADTLAFVEGGSEVMRIDSNGRLLVGTSSIIEPNGEGKIEAQNGSIAIGTFVNSAGQYSLSFVRSRGTASNVIVQSGDAIGALRFWAADGSGYPEAAIIRCEVDGTPSTNDMPGRLVFSVTADGAASPTEAMRIKNSRIINIANTPTYADNAAATSGGLVAGDVYRKSDGTLMIRF